jgi:hypothetical protein
VAHHVHACLRQIKLLENIKIRIVQPSLSRLSKPDPYYVQESSFAAISEDLGKEELFAAHAAAARFKIMASLAFLVRNVYLHRRKHAFLLVESLN